MFSSEHIENIVLTLTSEPPSLEDHFETKLKAKIYPNNWNFEKQEEELIELKGK